MSNGKIIKSTINNGFTKAKNIVHDDAHHYILYSVY